MTVSSVQECGSSNLTTAQIIECVEHFRVSPDPFVVGGGSFPWGITTLVVFSLVYLASVFWVLSDVAGRDDLRKRQKWGYVLGTLMFPWVMFPLYLINVSTPAAPISFGGDG